MKKYRLKKSVPGAFKEKPQQRHLDDEIKLTSDQHFQIFKEAIRAVYNSFVLDIEYSTSSLMQRFNCLINLELADNQCWVDYENVVITRERLFNPGIKTQIEAYFNPEHELVFQVVTTSEDDINYVGVNCEFKASMLGLDEEEDSLSLQSMYELFMIN